MSIAQRQERPVASRRPVRYGRAHPPSARTRRLRHRIGPGCYKQAPAVSRSSLRAVQRWLVVDADLRRPQASLKLGIGARLGLGSVIIGDTPLADALVEHPLAAAGAGMLLVLPAGLPPPNPSELLSSQEMQRLLTELESQSDLVIIDTPAALVLSDSLPLLSRVSGVVLVARMNRTTRVEIRRLQRIIVASSGTLLGVVATATSRGPGYEGYRYGYYYGSNGKGDSRRGLLKRPRRKLSKDQA